MVVVGVVDVVVVVEVVVVVDVVVVDNVVGGLLWLWLSLMLWMLCL